MRIPMRKSEKERLEALTVDYHVTPERLEALKRKLARLEREHPEAKTEMQHTAQDGDFSENAGYQDAKRRLRKINAQMLRTRDLIDQAIVIDEGPTDGTVGIGSTVELERNGKPVTFRIVGAQEIDLDQGRISHTSPLGSALLGKRVGDEVEVNNNTWTINTTVH